MEDPVIEFLSQFVKVTPEEAQALLKLQLIREYKKGTVLLRAGEHARECYLIMQGCIRSYYILEGEECTTDFFTEQQPVTPVSYVNGNPSAYYLSCVEDCIVSIGSTEKTAALVEQMPQIASWIGTVSTGLMAQQLEKFDDYKNLSAEQHYLRLLETRPGLVNRVPQYQLASYLGIQPESLSRIRRRLKEQQD